MQEMLINAYLTSSDITHTWKDDMILPGRVEVSSKYTAEGLSGERIITLPLKRRIGSVKDEEDPKKGFVSRLSRS